MPNAADRDRDRPLLLDLCANPGGDRDLQVGCGKLEPALIGGDQHVLSDRKGCPSRDGPSHDAETATEVLLQAGELHDLTPILNG